MSQRPLDIALYGATGFTGRLAARYLADHAPTLRWGLAGRDADKLVKIRDSLGPEFADRPLLIADSSRPETLHELAAQARVLITTAGPYMRYGSPVVAACVEQGTDYVDITGETPWVREMIDQHHERAKEKGLRIVPLCGFDSIPSDLGAYLAVQALRAQGQATRWARGYVTMKGGAGGGTVASALNLAETGQVKLLGKPLLLNPKERQDPAEKARSRDQREARYDPRIGAWTAPFFMETVNSRVVRRSNALFAAEGLGYGEQFTYGECTRAGSRWQAMTLTAGMAVSVALMSQGWGRALVSKLMPAPGAGPSEQIRAEGFTRMHMLAEGEGGAKVAIRIEERADPGFGFTTKCLCEAALALATQREALPDRAGLLTPATAFGEVLAERLRAAGVRIEQMEAQF